MKESAEKELNSSNFKEFTKQGVTVIDFWAEWCGPCKIMSPIFDQVAKEMKGHAKFGKVDVDQENEIAQEYEIMSIPTILIMKDGEQVDRSVGVIDKEDLIEKIKENL